MYQDALLTIEERDLKGSRIVVLRGELDMSNVQHLKNVFAQLDGAGPLVIDLSDLTFVDSAGLNAIAIHGRRLIETDVPLHIVVTRPAIRKLFAVTRLDQYFTLVDSLDEIPR